LTPKHYTKLLNPVLRYLLFVLLAVVPAQGGLLQAQPAKIPIDSSRLTVRSLPANALQKYRDDEEFNYKQQHPEGISLWERFWYWMYQHSRINNKLMAVVAKILLWGFCIFAFIYAILKFTGMDGIGLFTGNKKQDGLDYEVTEDDIYAINFTEAIADAVGQHNFRLAIRLLYLQTLRRLADRELIRWKPDKTNDVYAQELAGGPLYNDFTWLTRAYDYAWYGDFPVHEEQFTEVQQHFQTFQRQLPV